MITDNKNIKLEKEFYGQKTCLIAKSGYGKSYTARVMIEDGRENNHLFLIFDPQDAYLDLPEFIYIDVENVTSVKGIALLCAQAPRNVVFRLKKLTIEQQQKFVDVFLKQYRKHAQKGIQTVVIDEAHKFAPETQKAISKETVRGMCQENRSDGIGIILISQRISRLDKTCISQADNLCIGRVTSFRDKQAVKNYIDSVNDVDEKIAKLKQGDFYFYGFNLDGAQVAHVRKSRTQHSGNSPKDLISEDKETFDKYKNRFIKNGSDTMSKDVNTQNEPIKNVLPSMGGIKDMVGIGIKVSAGGALSGVAGNLIATKIKSPIPYVSSRTLGSAGSSVALYTGYRMIKNESIKDVFKYATAGSMAYTAGSLFYDVVAVTGFQMPNVVNFAVNAATGAGNAQTSTPSVNADMS